MSKDLSYYLKKLSRLRADSSNPWPAATLGKAPYKPLLLMSVIDLVGEGAIQENQIELDPELSDLFHGYWHCVMPDDWMPNIAMPFYYMKSEGFWHLLPSSDNSELHISKPTVTQLANRTHGARLDNSLFQLIQDPEARETLRALLIDRYFSDDIKPRLREQARINIAAFHYSRRLIRQALGELEVVTPENDEPVREQGFRRAVVSAYDHRCAFCRISIRTPDHHTVVEAAHIIPWSVSRNDDPRNGLALCRLCHWTFDKGLLGLDDEYSILFSKHLHTSYNRLGHIGLLEGSKIYGPEHDQLWPDEASLSWHRKEVFLRA